MFMLLRPHQWVRGRWRGYGSVLSIKYHVYRPVSCYPTPHSPHSHSLAPVTQLLKLRYIYIRQPVGRRERECLVYLIHGRCLRASRRPCRTCRPRRRYWPRQLGSQDATVTRHTQHRLRSTTTAPMLTALRTMSAFDSLINGA